MNITTLPDDDRGNRRERSLGPHDIGVHHGQYGFLVARIDGRIRTAECGAHAGRLLLTPSPSLAVKIISLFGHVRYRVQPSTRRSLILSRAR